MKPIQQHKDPRITNISFDNFTGSTYILNPLSTDENREKFMLTSPQTNGADHFIPSHHLALITQPVLGARSRSRKKTTNIIVKTSPSPKDTLDSMTNSRRSSYNDSPPLILPINRIDTLQYQKKTNSHHESSDSGVDLSLSTNSSVQLQQYPQQHITIHRPLSALNEDSSPDDGYHDEHQQVPLNNARLRFPPVNFGRNRSMEDIISNSTGDQQHRSSSFSDERQQKLFFQQEQKIKRSSDGVLLDLIDTPTDHYQRTNTFKNQLLYPSTNQQHRSFNDLTNKTSNKVLPIRNESNMSTNINNLPTTHTMIRKPNTSTLKPLRKKTKLNTVIEPLASSRLGVYDEQINTMTGTTSSSSNQTTPRSTRPTGQQQIKPNAPTPLSHYPNHEQIRAHVNRSVVERQHPPAPPRRGIIQQMVPFDASPSKVNNLLLRHHVQHQPTTFFHHKSNNQLSPSRQLKQILPTLYDEETISNVQEEKRKPKETHQKGQTRIKIKDNQESILTKINHKRESSQDQFEQTNTQRYSNDSIQKHPEKELSFDNHINRQQRNTGYTADPVHLNRSDEKQRIPGSKPTGIIDRNKTQNNSNDKNLNRTTESNGQYGPDYSHNTQKNTLVNLQSRPSKINLQTYENPTTRQSTQWQNSQYGNDHYPWQKSQTRSTSKPTRIQPIVRTNTNNSNFERERETSRLSNISKTDSIQQFKQKNSPGTLQSKLPTSWSITSEHQIDQQPLEIYEKTSRYQSESSTSPSSNDELIEQNSTTSARTYRLIIDDQQQPLDGRYIIPSKNLQVSSSHTSSHQTHSFICTPDFENSNGTILGNSSHKKQKSIVPPDVYTLSDRDSTQNTIDRENSPSPLVHFPSNKKLYSPSLPTKLIISTDKDEITSNYDSDDGWSDDSVELLYVDERYATEKRKITPSSHLPSQQHYHYQIQQQNVLLQ